MGIVKRNRWLRFYGGRRLLVVQGRRPRQERSSLMPRLLALGSSRARALPHVDAAHTAAVGFGYRDRQYAVLEVCGDAFNVNRLGQHERP